MALRDILPVAEFERDFHAAPLIEWVKNHTEIPIFCVTGYLALVFYAPGVMNKPYRLRKRFALWNLFLSVFSMIGMSRVVPLLVNTFRAQGFQYTVCTHPREWYLEGPVGLWVALFIFSKIPELIDTLFLVLQMKKIIFLHWFHHATVLLYCWHAFHNCVGPGIWFAAMNYSVHSIMYLYYFCSIIGYSRFARPLAPLITALQLMQMVVGSTVTSLSAYWFNTGAPCAVDPANYKLGLGMYLAYLILFAVLFYNNYMSPNARHRKLTRKEDDKICGVDASSLQVE